jgi:hypothetical protein
VAEARVEVGIALKGHDSIVIDVRSPEELTALTEGLAFLAEHLPRLDVCWDYGEPGFGKRR